MGNPKNHMALINPSCSAERPNCSPNWGKIPALMENEKAVVIRAKQLPLNKALLLRFSFIEFGFRIYIDDFLFVNSFGQYKKNEFIFHFFKMF